MKDRSEKPGEGAWRETAVFLFILLLIVSVHSSLVAYNASDHGGAAAGGASGSGMHSDFYGCDGCTVETKFHSFSEPSVDSDCNISVQDRDDYVGVTNSRGSYIRYNDTSVPEDVPEDFVMDLPGNFITCAI